MTQEKINYTNLLPRGSAKKIHAKARKLKKCKISLRQVQRIIAGTSGDAYGIIDLVISEATAHKKAEERRKERAAALAQNKLNP